MILTRALQNLQQRKTRWQMGCVVMMMVLVGTEVKVKVGSRIRLRQVCSQLRRL